MLVMKMMQQTSLMAYRKVALSDGQAQVYKIIKLYPARCNKQIAMILGWEINRVTPRVLELRKAGRIYESGKALYNGRSVIVYKVTINERFI